jgi:hypothetical protein
MFTILSEFAIIITEIITVEEQIPRLRRGMTLAWGGEDGLVILAAGDGLVILAAQPRESAFVEIAKSRSPACGGG